MKIKLIITFILSTFTLAGQNFPEFEDEPVWHLESYDYLGQGTADVKLKLSIDSCGKEWYPIEQTSSYENATPQKIGYFLQEGAKVFYKKKLDCDEKNYLMYDFSLEEGDSAYIGIPYSNYLAFPDLDSVKYKVNKVEYLDYQSYLRKTLHVSFLFGSNDTDLIGYSSTWVEGVGDLLHPFPSAICLPNSFACEVEYRLSCLKTAEGTFFSREGVQCDLDQSNPSIIYVNQSNSGMAVQDGKSWETAFENLNSAIAIAEYGDNIWVAQGIYYPTNDLDRTVYFELKNGIKIYGGFAGTEIELTKRDWDNFPTFLSGNIGDTSEITDNSYHVIYAIGVDSSTILDGFVIEDGYAIHPSPTYAGPLVNGGGMLIDTDMEHNTSIPQIRNSIFRNNRARNGGAVYCNGSQLRFACPQFFNCMFYQNRGEGEGGAILKAGKNPDFLTQRFINCTFEQNWAKRNGGGVGLIDASGEFVFQNCKFQRDTAISGSGGIHFETYLTDIDLSLEGCQFESNQGSEGGALNFTYTGFSNPGAINKIRITNSTFILNEAKIDRGGALMVSNSNIFSELSIEKSYFEGNLCLGRGGAVFHDVRPLAESKIIVSSSVFKNNYVRGFPGSGAIGISGTSFNNEFKTCNLLVFNSLFENNSGVLTVGNGSFGIATADLVNCTFYENGEFPFAKGYSDLFRNDSFYTEINIANSVIWEPGIDFSQLFVNGSPDNQTLFGYNFENCLISDENCDLPGGNIACGQSNIFKQDPQFLDPINGDFRLHPCSPAINRGKNNLITPISENLDLAMQQRIQENVVDIGAYEQSSSALNIVDIEVTLPSCHDSNDGSVLALVDSSSVLNYDWKNVLETGEGNTGLSEGVYQFTVSDENNCQGNFIVSVDAPDSIQASYTLIHPNNNSSGTIELNSILGGSPPYSYIWNTGNTSSSITELSMGEYNVTISDQNNCSVSLFFQLENVTDTRNISDLNQILIAPNPLKLPESLWIDYTLDHPGQYRLMLTDLTGKVIKFEVFNLSRSGKLELAEWLRNTGVHFLSIYYDNSLIGTTKILAH